MQSLHCFHHSAVILNSVDPAPLLFFGVCFDLEIVFSSLFMFWLFYFIIFIVLTQVFYGLFVALYLEIHVLSILLCVDGMTSHCSCPY